MPPLRLLSFSAALAAWALGASPVLAAAIRAPAPAKTVDAARLFTGRWIEIGRRPMKLTDGCVAGATNYLPRNGTKIEVRDTCNKNTPTGKLKTISGPGVITDPGTNTKLHVTYKLFGFIPVARDYWILDHDESYHWFISCNPAFTDLWIYTRETRPNPALIATLVAKANAMGYDVTKLEFPAQP